VPPLREGYKSFPIKEGDMTSIADSSVIIQTSSESVPSTPVGWGKWCSSSTIFANLASSMPSPEPRSLCPPPLRARRGDRLSRRALRLRHEWRAHPRGVLRAACSPLRSRSWPSSGARACPRARRSRAISRALTPEAVEALRSLFLADLLARPPLQRARDRWAY
jgi:hypothetical protein